jgi:hypothetical protein
MNRPTDSPDSRHAPIRERIAALYAAANGGLTVPWTGRHAKVLANLLRENSSWTLAIWLRCIENRFRSEGINPAQDPVAWINRLVDYARGPLDKFGGLKQQSHNDVVAAYWDSQRRG